MFRERIVRLAEAESFFNAGEIEVDESYFGARRVRGKRGRGAAGGRASEALEQVVQGAEAGERF